MEHNEKSPVEPVKSSSGEFCVKNDNQFIVLDDAKHVIGVSGRNSKKLILENVENGSKVEFERLFFSFFYTLTLIFDEDTGSLYSGDIYGKLVQYKVDTANQICEEVKTYGNLGIDIITSSHRFLDFVFFGGIRGKIKVLDISTGKLLSGHIDTSIIIILSLQVCVKNPKQIYLAVSGTQTNYSNDKTDLFDITDFLQKDLVILQKNLSQNSKYQTQNIPDQQSITKSQIDTIKKLTKKYQKYKTMYSHIKQKYDDLKDKHDTLRNKNKIIKKAYKTLKMESDRKYDQFTKKMNLVYQHRNKRTTIGNKMPLIGSGLFDQIDPLVIIRDLKEDLEEQKYKYKKLEGSMYDVLTQKKNIEEQSEAKDLTINLLENQSANIKQVVGNR